MRTQYLGSPRRSMVLGEINKHIVDYINDLLYDESSSPKDFGIDPEVWSVEEKTRWIWDIWKREVNDKVVALFEGKSPVSSQSKLKGYEMTGEAIATMLEEAIPKVSESRARQVEELADKIRQSQDALFEWAGERMNAYIRSNFKVSRILQTVTGMF